MTGPILAAIAAVALGQAAAPVNAPGGATGGPVGSLAPPAAGAAAPAVARRVEGRVTFATATTAYLDAGSAEGIAPGQVIRLSRGGQPSGTCTVRETADHSATCLGPGLKAGDRFAVDTTVPGAPVAAKLAPVPTDEELAGRNAAVTATPVVLVESKAQPRDIVVGTLPSLRGDLGYALWLGSPGGPGDSQRIQLDVQLNGIDTFAGFKLYGDARFLQWTQKDSTYVPGSNTSLLVYDLELAQRDPKRNWTAAFGRVSPWFVPGATVFDGAQGGLRFGRTEVGVFGGLVPETWTTAPTVSQYTGGAYVKFEVPIDGTLLSGGARAAVVHNDAVQTHYEGELLLSYWAGKVLSASGNLRMGFGDVRAPASIDSARIVATVRPADIAWITAGFSYWGLTVPDGEPIATYPGPARRADASAGVDATKWLRIALLGGWNDDLTSGLSHSFVGPEVTFTSVLAGLSFGYLKDFGWVDGQNVWGQLAWAPAEGSRLTVRASWWQTLETVQGLTSPTTSNDLGLTVNGTVALNRWLGLRGLVMLRGGIDNVESSLPFGVVANVFLTGTY